MKVVCVVAVHKRVPISLATVRLLNQQTHPITVVVVGGAAEEKEFLKSSVRCDFLTHPNEPLGAKWQAGINAAKKHNPDAVMICGSDTWLTTNWVEKIIPYISEHDVIGKSDFYTCSADKNERIGIFKRSYNEDLIKKNFVVGSGRMLSKRILDKIKWSMFPPDINFGLDTHSYKKIQAQKGKYFSIKDHEDVLALGIKSNQWDTITPLKKLRDIPATGNLRAAPFPGIPPWRETKHGSVENYFASEKWLEQHFPGCLQTLVKICGCLPGPMEQNFFLLRRARELLMGPETSPPSPPSCRKSWMKGTKWWNNPANAPTKEEWEAQQKKSKIKRKAKGKPKGDTSLDHRYRGKNGKG